MRHSPIGHHSPQPHYHQQQWLQQERLQHDREREAQRQQGFGSWVLPAGVYAAVERTSLREPSELGMVGLISEIRPLPPDPDAERSGKRLYRRYLTPLQSAPEKLVHWKYANGLG
ncbi:hypothetical protein ACIP5Y_23795 [Nocardia sp. NPDC088792]|uniref:hypothetical protein n=1 Tax=Nocardia sp. NPDC088792 TaxID=3364332 RepID=UPI00381BD7A6